MGHMQAILYKENVKIDMNMESIPVYIQTFWIFYFWAKVYGQIELVWDL